ncbi:MAG TPA: fused MFS/spermidine synthase [Propionibacteriaceae bacterium]|nr:fused MFS/spermidine synthase [Propionibacteriaceae bacterium]
MRSASLILRPGADGARLVPDLAYPRAFTLRVGRTDQSYVDLDDPLRLEFDYVQRLVDVLDSVAEPGQRLRVVHVGGAAMTLPRYVAATRPTSAQIVLEPDIELTTFVRRYLPLPTRSGIKVRGIDGRRGIAALHDGYADLIIIDAFVGARVPAELTTAEFLADNRRALNDHGVLIINVTDRGPLDYARRVLAGVRRAFPHVLFCAESSTLKGRRFGNVIIAGGMTPLPYAAIAQRVGCPPFPYRLLRGARLHQLLADSPPFSDNDAAESPEPGRDLRHFS